ncbi:MAG: nucleotidyltransferase domain-containing protein [Bryobacteraceae bacterium]
MGTVPNVSDSPIGSALFGRTRQAVLRIFFSNPDRRFYQRLIICDVGLGSGTVQRELKELTRAQILTRTVEGHTYYQANRCSPVFDDLRGLIRKTFGVTQALQTALSSIAKKIHLAFIYGSVAGGSERPESDVDVIVVANNVSLGKAVHLLSDAQHKLGREINPSVYGVDEFYRKLAEGHYFISSIMAAPKILLIGEESEFKRLEEKRLAQGAQGKPAANCRTIRHRGPRPRGVANSRAD